MYICKNQLGKFLFAAVLRRTHWLSFVGIEKEYEQKVMPDGKFNVDGFICVFDVSMVPSRPIERQMEYTATILANLVKSKKPIVLATTKNDEAFDGFIREAEKLVSRKEFKGTTTRFLVQQRTTVTSNWFCREYRHCGDISSRKRQCRSGVPRPGPNGGQGQKPDAGSAVHGGSAISQGRARCGHRSLSALNSGPSDGLSRSLVRHLQEIGSQSGLHPLLPPIWP